MSARGFLKDLTLHQQKVRFRNTGGSRGESQERGKAFFPTIRVRLVGTENTILPGWSSFALGVRVHVSRLKNRQG